MWYVYVVQSQRTKLWYTGSTKDLRKRISEHNMGKTVSTRLGIPWNLLYNEASHNRKDARSREKYLKSGMGKRYIRNRLKFFFAEGNEVRLPAPLEARDDK